MAEGRDSNPRRWYLTPHEQAYNHYAIPQNKNSPFKHGFRPLMLSFTAYNLKDTVEEACCISYIQLNMNTVHRIKMLTANKFWVREVKYPRHWSLTSHEQAYNYSAIRESICIYSRWQSGYRLAHVESDTSNAGSIHFSNPKFICC